MTCLEQFLWNVREQVEDLDCLNMVTVLCTVFVQDACVSKRPGMLKRYYRLGPLDLKYFR